MPNKLYRMLSLLINKIPYAKTILANLGVDRVISYGQRLVYCTLIITLTHTRTILCRTKYINQNATGDPNTIWPTDILIFANYTSFRNCLVIGCCNGWAERQLYDMGVGLNFDAFDISEKYIEMAKQKTRYLTQ